MKARNEKEKEGKSLLNIYLDILTKSIMNCKKKTTHLVTVISDSEAAFI